MKIKMVTQTPSDRNLVTWIHRAVAWAAARGIAKDTYHAVILYGEYGTARFNGDGSGVVMWNEKSTTPGEQSSFAHNSTVMI